MVCDSLAFNPPAQLRRALEASVATALASSLLSRRLSSRVETQGDVWVYWRCDGIEDVSRVCDLSVGGLFLFTPIPPPVGGKATLDFLVQEGRIRAEAVVRHQLPNNGAGLKFAAITDQDCPNLVALMNRIRNLSSAPQVPSFVPPSH
jgi:hypothetical protein